MKTKNEWVHIGDCAVDSGQLIIADPCYVLPSGKKDVIKTGHADEGKQYTYQNLFDLENSENFTKKFHEIVFSGIAGTGVRFDSGLGDGVYPVYAKIEDLGEWGKRVTEVKINLLGRYEKCYKKGGDK